MPASFVILASAAHHSVTMNNSNQHQNYGQQDASAAFLLGYAWYIPDTLTCESSSVKSASSSSRSVSDQPVSMLYTSLSSSTPSVSSSSPSSQSSANISSKVSCCIAGSDCGRWSGLILTPVASANWRCHAELALRPATHGKQADLLHAILHGVCMAHSHTADSASSTYALWQGLHLTW